LKSPPYPFTGSFRDDPLSAEQTSITRSGAGSNRFNRDGPTRPSAKVPQRPRTRSAAVGRKLFVGNLPYTTGEQELQELFGQVGPVDSVSVMRDMATGRPRGFAFVEMSSDADAQRAITEFHDRPFGGRNLTVNEARPRPERSGGPGGGFGGDRGGFGGGRGGRGGRGGGGGRREPRW
jgi:cold-inducible RNA-binding protein